MTLTSPGSAGFGLFTVDQSTGQVRYDPQGSGGGWSEGVTTTRLRGLVRDLGTGALVIADLASVDVTRPDETDPLLAIFGGGDTGYLWDPSLSTLYQSSDQTGAVVSGDPVGWIGNRVDGATALISDPAERATWGGGGTLEMGGVGSLTPPPGAAEPLLFYADPAYEWTLMMAAELPTSGVTELLFLKGQLDDEFDRRLLIYWQGDRRLGVYSRGKYSVGSGVLSPGMHVITVRWSGAALEAKIDALGWMTLDGGDIALRTPAPLRIGGALSGGSLTLPMTGSLGPILAIDRSLSDAEVASAVTIIADRAAT